MARDNAARKIVKLRKELANTPREHGPFAELTAKAAEHVGRIAHHMDGTREALLKLVESGELDAATCETLRNVGAALDRAWDAKCDAEGTLEELSGTTPLDADELADAAAYIEALIDPCKRHVWSHLGPDRALTRVSDALHVAIELAS
jgi:hypothetical protein